MGGGCSKGSVAGKVVPAIGSAIEVIETLGSNFLGQQDTSGYKINSLPIRVISASNIPPKDLNGLCDAYVIVEAVIFESGDAANPLKKSVLQRLNLTDNVLASAKSSVHEPSANPVWEETLFLQGPLTHWEIDQVAIRVTLMDKDYFSRDDLVGTCIMPLKTLLRRPERELFLINRQGNAVVNPGKPPAPVIVKLALGKEFLPPSGWPLPSLVEYGDGRFDKHILIMSRGTRGDVQPFVALACGMAEQHNWLITFATELRWRDFVLSKTKNLKRGAVRFRPTGGDTSTRIETWIARYFMESKLEMLQCMMMAWSEADFFSSAPVLVHIAEQLQLSHTPVDLLIHSFTLTGLAMLVSERCGIPMAGFILQPSSIPSADKDWKCVGMLEDERSLTARVGRERFTTHDTLQKLKSIAESNPFSSYSLPQLRKDFGLPPANTWRTLQELNVPMVIPMMPSTFKRPSDWPDKTILTDFIFLRENQKLVQEPSLPENIQNFIENARHAGRRLVLMTFSSMPVARRKMLECATKMLTSCKWPHALLYVGKRFPDSIPKTLADTALQLTEKGSFLEVTGADFGVLFKKMDAFIVHGGLGTTVEALRMKKPVAVTGLLLMDQRFWAGVCYDKGVGPAPVHIDSFDKVCVEFVDKALDPSSEWLKTAQGLHWGDEAGDGVEENVTAFVQMLQDGVKPIDSRLGTRQVQRQMSISGWGEGDSRKTQMKAPPPALPQSEHGAHRFTSAGSHQSVTIVTPSMIEEEETRGPGSRRLRVLKRLSELQEQSTQVQAALEHNEREYRELEHRSSDVRSETFGLQEELNQLGPLPPARIPSE